MFLQVLPTDGNHNEEFGHLSILTETVKQDELFSLEAEEVLHRLYHEEEVRLYEPVAVTFKCTCSKERSAKAIPTVSKEEVNAIIAEVGKVEMGCEYCNSKYIFDSIDIEAIYANAPSNDVTQ